MSAQLWAIIGAVAGVIGLGFAVFQLRSARNARSLAQSLGESASQARFAVELAGTDFNRDAVVAAGGPPPLPPGPLVDACVRGECVLFAGMGLAASVGRPTWREALFEVLSQCQRKYPADDLWNSLAAEVRDGKYDVAVELLITRLGRGALLEMLRDVLAEAGQRADPSRTYRALRSVRFAGVINGAWDTLADELFADRSPVVLVPKSAEEFGETMLRRDFFVLMPYGFLSDADRILTTDELREELGKRSEYARFLRSCYATRTMLFVGSSVAGIEDFLRGAGLYGAEGREHYALVPHSADAELHGDRLQGRFNVKLITYEAGPGHPQVLEFIEELGRLYRKGQQAGQLKRREPAPLTTVRLRNIGPFSELDWNLKPGWNVLVADNGCGKSTVLRAIAMALCGNDDRATRTAGRLLKVGKAEGAIELRFGADKFVTRLVREGARVRIESELVTPVQTGEWLVLGFPPLRGVSTRRPEAPTGQRPLGPGVEDLLPLVTGDVDERLDDLKQWIVNRTFAEVTRRRRNAGAINDSVARFFRIATALMPEVGYWMEFSGIDNDTLEVMVRTPDGELPLQFLSQGMNSVIGWTGTLIARLEDVEAAGVPAGGIQGIVLVDEIDSHLHPKWQRKIVKAIRDEFAGVQVIATTHSPLLLGSIPDAGLLHLQRENGVIVADQFDHDYRGLGADQILASGPFDTSPRDEES